MQNPSECRTLAGSTSVGNGATSHSKPVIERSSGTSRRDDMNIATLPSRKRSSTGLASASSAVGDQPLRRRASSRSSPRRPSGVSSSKRVGLSSSSTSSPPAPQIHGAVRIRLTSMPTPWRPSPVSFFAAAANCS